MSEDVRRSGLVRRIDGIDVGKLEKEIDRRWSEANQGSKAWSFTFHATFGMATVAGVLVAAISGRSGSFLGISLDKYIPAIAMIGSICSAVGIFGGFERKWKANRTTRNRLDILGLQLKAGYSVEYVVDQLIDILRTHDAAIVQSDDDTGKRPPSDSGHSDHARPKERDEPPRTL